jgi:hypothetical protein
MGLYITSILLDRNDDNPKELYKDALLRNYKVGLALVVSMPIVTYRPYNPIKLPLY